MILSLKTSGPTCEMTLFQPDGELLGEKNWLADRELARDLLAELEKFLHTRQLTWENLTGLIIFQGPGSFTGLRIGITVMNTLSESLNIPIVGLQGKNWKKEGLGLLSRGKNHQIVLPEYGSEPHITRPKK